MKRTAQMTGQTDESNLAADFGKYWRKKRAERTVQFSAVEHILYWFTTNWLLAACGLSKIFSSDFASVWASITPHEAPRARSAKTRFPNVASKSAPLQTLGQKRSARIGRKIGRKIGRHKMQSNFGGMTHQKYDSFSLPFRCSIHVYLYIYIIQ